MKQWLNVVVALATALAALGCRADVVVIENGRARAVICAPQRVMEPNIRIESRDHLPREQEEQRQRLRESVKDLALYLEKMSGAAVEISTERPPEQPGQTTRILVAELAEAAFGKPAKSALYKQGFRVVVSGKDGGVVGLIGESDLATSYAIYEVLDRLGCRWFMPGEMGEAIPSWPTIALPEMDLSSAPDTAYRGIWYADDAYQRRNRMGGLKLAAHHALERYVSEQDRQEHPEWRATVDGKPSPTRLKWSNEELARYIADRLSAGLDANPRPSLSLSPEDGLGFDNSPEDRALDAGDWDPGFDSVSITDRLIHFCNSIAQRVTEDHPDVLFGLLAYVNYTRPPVREDVHSNIVPQIAPITYARAHPMNMPGVPGNEELRYIVKGWAAKSKMTSYYFYGWFLAEPVAPNPMLAKWGHDVPFVLRKGNCQFWQPETQPNFETSMHALYMANRLAWDRALDPDDIYREIDEKFYGHAAEQMTAYWRFIDGVWVNTPEYSGCGFAYLRRWTPEVMSQARALMNEAVAAAQTPEEKFRVGMVDDSLSLFEDFMRLRVDLAEGRLANLAADADAWREKRKALSRKYKAQYAFTPLAATYFNKFYGVTYRDASRIAAEAEILTTPPLRHWKYRADRDQTGEAAGYASIGFDDDDWKTTDVPSETWSTLGYHDYFGSMWYRTDVTLPEVDAGKKVFLWLGATDGSAKVFVNGEHVPYVSHKGTAQAFEGYCRPASFDITSAVKPGSSNTIAILCTRTFMNELGTGGLLAPVVIYAQ